MKKVININFQGSVVPIEESAYDILKEYIESLRLYFFNEDGRDEIINDIESRIGELFQENLKNGSTCITDADVNVIINNIGRPADFEEAETGEKPNDKDKEGAYTGFAANLKGKRLYRDENNKILGGVASGIGAYMGIDPVIVRVLFIVSGIGLLAYILLWIFVPGSNSLVNGARKRLYRNPETRIIAGVCSGIGSYFNISAWIPRIIFLIPFISFVFRWGHFGPITFPNFLTFSFSPGTLIIYIILWLVIPEAITTSEKLQMKGEKVDLNSIKNSVMQEMQGVKERVGKMGKEIGEKTGNMGPQVRSAASRTGSAIGHVIVVLFKLFAYFILGCIALALIVALFGIGIASIGLFPLKAFVLNDGWQSLLAWGTLIFFIGIPVIGIITFIIRRIARIRSQNRIIRYSFLAMWLLGIFCFISLIFSVGSDFRRSSSGNEVDVPLTNASVSSLEVTSLSNNLYNRRNSWFRLEPFASFDDDTAYIGNVRIRIEKSATDSFAVGLIRTANGKTRRYADTLASLIDFKIEQQDSILMLDRAIAINTNDKFRNQSVIVTIYVPEGRYIMINKNLSAHGHIRLSGPWDNDWYYWDDEDYTFDYGVEYVMREDGLYTLSGIPAGEYRNNRRNWRNREERDWNYDDESDRYRYEKGNKLDSIRAQKENQLKGLRQEVDSLREAQDKERLRIKDSLREAKEKIEKKLETIDQSTVLKSSRFRMGKQGNILIMHI